jgi:nucleoid-associated protein YgaU
MSALEKRPNSPRIHWEIGSVFDQYATNDLRAIYHYERFLELDPKAERRQLAEELIGAAKLSFAASLPARPSEAVNEIARLRKEIDTLRVLLDEARKELAASSGVRVPDEVTTDASPEQARRALADSLRPAPPVATFETYTVKPGDTLSRIAGKMYGDTAQWNKIYDANRSTLPKPESVRVGQQLLIPR